MSGGSNQRTAAWAPHSEEYRNASGGIVSPMTLKNYDDQPNASARVLTYTGDGQIVLAAPETQRSTWNPLPPPGDKIPADSHVLTLTSCFRAKMLGNLQEVGNRNPPRRSSFSGVGTSQTQLPRSSTEAPWAPDSHVLQLTTSFHAKTARQSSPVMKGAGYLSPQLPARKERQDNRPDRALSLNGIGSDQAKTANPEVFDRLFNLHKKKIRKN